jgi:hypothetical protein
MSAPKVGVLGWTILVQLSNGKIQKLYDLPDFVKAPVTEHIELLEGVDHFDGDDTADIEGTPI